MAIVRKPLWTCATALALLSIMPTADSNGDHIEDYLDLPLHDLLSVEVTSAGKKSQKIAEAATSIFVISQEDIRRSGVTSIAEALRMAPGIQVGRIDSNKWAISSRGFNGRFANKLLVLIDGRSVYTRTFSGVYWDDQDLLLDDIDRIEVIRGPGATLWGSNAVNGVINIITQHTADTQGGLVTLSAGPEEKGLAGFRYGAQLSEHTHGRVYVKHTERDGAIRQATGKDAGDDWQTLRGGFRVDSEPLGQNQWTVQGDIYDATVDQYVALLWSPTPPFAHSVNDEIESSGWNLLTRWNHRFSQNSSATLQLFYDHSERDDAAIGQSHDTYDIEFHHQLRLGQRHDILWGLGYRYMEDKFRNTFAISITPDAYTHHTTHAFVQDEIELIADTLLVTIGTKFENSERTGMEVQPNARAMWLPNDTHVWWAAISRAARTPSLIEQNGRIVLSAVPIVNAIDGNDNLNSEKLTAYELGYRVTPVRNLSLDLATFYNDYEDLRTIDPASPTSSLFSNGLSGSAYGLEIALDWHPKEWWRLQSSYTYLNISLQTDDTSLDVTTEQVDEGSSPRHQLSLRSAMDLGARWTLDLWLYYTGAVDVASINALSTDTRVDSNANLSARLAWTPSPGLEFSLTGHNLLDDAHLEYVGELLTAPTEIQRSIYGQVRWEF